METAPLKSFATWARTALIREVTARMAAVLAPGSSERVEQTRPIAALEKAVATAGGGDKGRAAVADKVAYTWFNRIIALRFMDANGYTGVGVVSPQTGVELGQPEILAEAKRGVIDTEVTSQATRKAVAGLFDGTRASGDPQGEVYALLLADYCRYWNKAMPFMFEREGDFTELLIPANLLADDSVLNRSVKVLTEDVCKDVEVIGWLYQFYISERKDEVFAGFKKNKKAGADEIPAATQLFTPHWIVRYLVENSLGRLWMLNRPTSRLVDQMDYYIAPVDEETDFLKIAKPEELRVIDPACGSGHMLTYAFDLLYAIYEEEGYAPSEIPELVLANNLHGTEIDPRAGALAAFALTMKARAKQRTFFSKQVEPNVCVIDVISFGADELDFMVTRGGDRDEEITFWNQFAEAGTVGSLIRADPALTAWFARHVESLDDGGDLLKANTTERARRVVKQAEYLTPRYSVVVANPPYMGAGNMNGYLTEFSKREYPDARFDLFAMFIERNTHFTAPGGFVAMITMQSWLFLASYENLRLTTVSKNSVVALAHLGTNAFDTIGGAVVSTAAFVIAVAAPTQTASCIRLVEGRSEAEKERVLRSAVIEPSLRHVMRSSDFADIPGAPFVYWASSVELELLRKPKARLDDVAETREGLTTGDNDRYLRQWFEVSRMRLRLPGGNGNEKWVPHVKGGGTRRWYGHNEYAVDWENDGAELRGRRPQSVIRSPRHYFKTGFTWSSLSGGSFAVRHVPGGFIFDTKGPMGFARDGQLTSLSVIEAVLNSAVATRFMTMLAPTLDFKIGHVRSLPVVDGDAETLSALAERCVEISKADWDAHETSWDFAGSPFLENDVRSELIEDSLQKILRRNSLHVSELRAAEESINVHLANLYELGEVVDSAVPIERVTLDGNPAYRYGSPDAVETARLVAADACRDLVSYAVGCMFGRFSLDLPGLILADQGSALQVYRSKVSAPVFTPDSDNVIPILDDEWFEDDVIGRFRQFLKVAFGEQHFEANLQFIEKSLGVKSLRDYFAKRGSKATVSRFYDDHIQRYKKRPIYWLFSSSKGSFNALIYMHRYTPSTVSTVLNEYLREFQAKVKASVEQAERGNNAKEADRLRKILLELDDYEHDVLYPLASQTIAIDLDDGVKLNYPKFGPALKKIAGLEAKE